MSARLLTDGHLARAVEKARGNDSQVPGLGRDQMQLFSFYRPRLVAKDYSIEARQTVTSPRTPDGRSPQRLILSNTTADDPSGQQAPQQFEVVVPRFTIDPDIINSYYPPDGHQDEGRILPHIVFNDPHYPWEILPGTTTNLTDPIDGLPYVDKSGKNRQGTPATVPWLALLVFDTDELHIDEATELASLRIPGFTDADAIKRQNPNGAFPIKVKDYFADPASGGIAPSARINYEPEFKGDQPGLDEIRALEDVANFIFPKKELVAKMFSTADPKNYPDSKDHRNGIEQYKYLAHVRNINTEGCPDAGIEQQGLFSVLVSARTGALRDLVLKDNKWTEIEQNLSQPRTQIVHLVSLENLDVTSNIWQPKPSPLPQDYTNRIGLVSLFSWVYQAMPPNAVNFVTTMRNLTEHQQFLRVNDELLKKLDDNASANGAALAQKVLARRLKMGYTLARWRPQSGEQTAAITRGPLVPITVPSPPAQNTIVDCSSTGQDLQILDPDTGLNDLSYSSAWQLGKLLAISDTSFSAALMRFRSLIRNAASDLTRKEKNNMASRKSLLEATSMIVKTTQQRADGVTGDPKRATAPRNVKLVADVKNVAVLPDFVEQIGELVLANSGTVPDAMGRREPYTGFNLKGPSNSDWPVIHDWLAEKLSLGGIPTQYLIQEPSFLPLESLRFFYIDDFWLDSLVDGALSVANHLDEDDDMVRRAIKDQFNHYLDTIIPEAGIKPQIPCCGFIIRSKLIKAMPDLKITVTWTNLDARYPVCRWTRWDDQTLMCLLDRRFEELASIKLAQPQHQQRYAMGSAIDAEDSRNGVTFVLRKIVTETPGIYPDGGKTLTPSQTQPWLDLSTRRLQIQTLANDVNQLLRDWKDGPDTPLDKKRGVYEDPSASSCELGIALNDPAYFFQIKPPPATDTTQHDRRGNVISKYDSATFKNRQLFIRWPSRLPPSPPPNRPLPRPPATSTAPPNSQALNNLIPPTTQPRVQPYIPSRTGPPSSTGSPSGLTRKFKLKVYADYKGPPKHFDQALKFDKDDFIPTQNKYYFDLIFGLRKIQDADYKLLKIAIDVPMRVQKGPDDAAWEPLLTDIYHGPGLRMLSNQRFVPFLFTSTITPKQGVVLAVSEARWERTAWTWQGMDPRTANLSFRLAEAPIVATGRKPKEKLTVVDIDGGPRERLGVSTIWMTEWYQTDSFPGGEAVKSQIQVLKRDITDPKEGA